MAELIKLIIRAYAMRMNIVHGLFEGLDIKIAYIKLIA